MAKSELTETGINVLTAQPTRPVVGRPRLPLSRMNALSRGARPASVVLEPYWDYDQI